MCPGAHAVAFINRTHPATGKAFTFRPDGWFNMTSAAKHFGKDLSMFWLNVSTGEYLLALSETLNTGKSQDWSQDHRPREERLAAARTALAEASRGGNHMGTWAHPKLARSEVIQAEAKPRHRTTRRTGPKRTRPRRDVGQVPGRNAKLIAIARGCS